MLTASRMLSACTVAFDRAVPSRTSTETLIIGSPPSSLRGCSLSLMPDEKSRSTLPAQPGAEVAKNPETRAPRHQLRGRGYSHRGACRRPPAAGWVASRVENEYSADLPGLRRT